MFKFTHRILFPTFIDDVMSLQNDAFRLIKDNEILRANDYDAIYDCLKNHYTIGVFDSNNVLAGFGVLFFPKDSNENLAHYAHKNITNYSIFANVKLVIVHPKYRGLKLQQKIVSILEHEAKAKGIKELFCTISPKNSHSLDNMTHCGYKILTLIENKYGNYSRYILQKAI